MFSSSSSLVGNATPPESSPSLAAAAAASPSPSPSQHSSTLSSSATVSLAGGTLVPSSTSTVPSSSPNTNITSSNSNEQLTQQQQQQQSNQAISCSDSAALSQPVTSSTAEESPSPHSSSSAAAALLQRSHSLSSAFYRPELGGNSQQQQHILNNNDSSSGHRSQALSFSSGQTSLDQYFGSNQSPTIGTHCQSFISPQTPLFSVAAAVSVANCIVTNSNSNLNLSGSTSGHNISGPTAHRTSAVSSPAHSSSSGRATPTPTLTPLAPLAHFGPTQQQQQQQQQHHNTVQRHSSFSFQETPSFIGGGNSCSFNTQQQQQQQINSGSGLAPKRSFSNIYNGSTAPSIAKRSLVSHLQGHNTTAHASEGSDDSGFVSASSPTSGNLQQQQQQNSSTMMSTSPSLIGSGQYGHSDAISSAAVTATSYNFEDYSIPFSSGWTTLTNLDQATAAAMAAAAASQSPTALHHVSHTGLPLQMPPLQQSSLSSAAAAAISNNQQQQQQQQSQQASPSGTSLGLSGQSLHSGNGQGLMALKDIKMFQNYPSKSATTNAEIRILKQPETHHRARYMTEGSRGTIKDRTGRGYPVVQLAGYNKGPVKLQCFIGHDQKIGEPHLFYQACEVSGKTPYTFVKIDGFNTIELELLPKNNMQAVFDCMGILKERNVDVERKVLRNRRRSQGSRPGVNATEEAKMIRNTNKSRSTHCRMVFRLILPDTGEILQCVSEQILCTQPLGSPEIYKMSLRECDLKGGAELFVIGKNFHKDTKVIFESVGSHWRKLVSPQKEFLNSTHLVCQVPPYDGLNVNCLPLINVDVSVHCNHKNSDPMKFIYTNGFSSGIGISANGKRSSLVSGDAFDCTNLNPWNNVSAAVSAATANNNDRRNSPDSMPTSHSAAAAAAAASAQAASTHPLVYFDPSQSQLAAAAAYLRETGNVVASPIMTGANNTNALFLLERSDVLK